MKHNWVLVLLVLAASAHPRLALADDGAKVVEGVIVQVAGEEVIVDIGREQGLPSSAQVQVYRRVEVKHPVTGKTIVDRFSIGAMTLSSVGSLLSISESWKDLGRSPAVGDFVVFEPSGQRVLEAASAEGPEDSAPDPARAAVEEAFAKTLGRPLTERIALWEAYLVSNPSSPYLDKVGAELAFLRLELARGRQAAPPESSRRKPKLLMGKVSAPATLPSGSPLEINVSIVQRQWVEEVRLLWRRKGKSSFATVPMERTGDFNWRAVVRDIEPGTVEYFAEAVRTNGTLEPIKMPSGVARVRIVEPISEADGQAGRSRAETVVEFVDFKLGDGIDQFLRIESDYRYLIDRGLIKAFRAGVGIFQGEGGSLQEIEADQSRQRHVNFGFGELELELNRNFGVSGRVSVGNHHQTEQGTATAVLGFRTQIRLGESEGTRLNLGLSLTEDVGNEAWTELVLEVFDRVPISAQVAVTNLPVGADLGVSANIGVGYRFTDVLALSLRTGWNARTIDHYGFTMGIGALLTW